MIVLKRLREPVEADLGRGVTVRLKRLTAVETQSAEVRAVAATRELSRGEEVLARYGLDQADLEGGTANLADVGQRLALASVIGTVELALVAVEAWEGVALEDGTPAPVTRATLTALVLDPQFYRALARALDRATHVLDAEGNGSGPLGGGSSTPTLGPATAAAAASTTPLAAGERLDGAGDAARKSSTLQ